MTNDRCTPGLSDAVEKSIEISCINFSTCRDVGLAPDDLELFYTHRRRLT